LFILVLFYTNKPHLSIPPPPKTGKFSKKSGKFFFTLVFVVFGAFPLWKKPAFRPTEAKIHVSILPEAGLRQTAGCHSNILLLDEMEADRHRSDLLKTLRTATDGSKIPKGTPSGTGRTRRRV